MTAPPELPEEPLRFVSVGTVEPRKNQIEAMRAFSRLCARRRISTCASTSSAQSTNAVADEVVGLVAQEPRIRLHEYLPDEDVRNLVAASHATVFISLYEGFGLPIAESLWQGTPVSAQTTGR